MNAPLPLCCSLAFIPTTQGAVHIFLCIFVPSETLHSNLVLNLKFCRYERLLIAFFVNSVHNQLYYGRLSEWLPIVGVAIDAGELINAEP